jgi:hypothetical protein
MREESHLDDMRSAIRGDFERLAERRGGQELMSVPVEATPEPEHDLVPEVEVERPEPARSDAAPEALAAETERRIEPDGPAEEPEPLAARADETEPEGEVEPEAPRRSWLDRLLGR